MRLLPIAAALALAAAACRRAPPPPPAPREVVVAVPVGPVHLDPHGELDEYTASILHNAYEWLATFDPDTRPVPSLAERWSTLDDRTWLFELRRGVRFHDGRAFDARVAAEIYRRELARSPEVGEILESVEARSDRELLIRTRQPQVSAVEVAHIPMTLPAADGSPWPVGTGAFTIAQGTAGGDVRLRAFDAYRDGRPPIDELVFRVIASEEQRLADLARGRVHVALNLSAAGARQVEGLDAARLVRRGSLRVIALGLVTKAGGGLQSTPFGDARARRAIVLALDRGALVREALGGYGEVVDQMVTSEVFGHVPEVPPIRPDLAEARRLLAAAGIGDGSPLALGYPSGRYQAIDAVAEAVARQLRAAGLAVTVQAEPAETLASDPARTPAFLMGWITSHSALRTYAALFHTPDGGRGLMNRTRFSDASVDADLAAALRLPIAGQRQKLAALALRIREELPVVPLYRQLDLYGVARGLEFTPRAQRFVLGRELRWASTPTP